MSPDNIVVLAVVALLASNYLVTRTQVARRYPVIFWIIIGLDVLVGVGVLLFGAPGFESSPMVRLVLGLVVLMHLAQNFLVKTRWDADDRAAMLDEEDARRFASEGTPERE